MWAKQKGFTIVELLIVIVVIAILAAISIVAYNGIQQRARDSQRKNDLSQIVKALHLYNIDRGTFAGAGSGCGAAGNGSGGIDVDYDGATTTLKSIEQCLIDGNYLSRGLRDPQSAQGCTGTAPNQSCAQYIKTECGGSNGTYLFANLESVPHTATDTDTTCSPTFDTAYGMNYFVRVN